MFNKSVIFLTELRPEFSSDSKIAFSIFGVSVTWYAIIILSGAIIGTLFGYYRYAKRLHMKSDLVSEGLGIGLALGVLFARLYYVLFSLTEGKTYDSIIDIINPRSGGLAIHGAIIAVIIYLPIWCKFRKIKLLTLLEIALPLILFAQVVGRWGNFVNQEAFGSLIKVSGDTSSGILTDAQLLEQRDFLKNLLIPDFIIDRMYISHSSATGFSIPGYYHPTFLYESVLNLVGLTAYMIIRKFVKKLYVGDGVSFYLIWYGGIRIFIESLRSDPLLINIFGITLRQAIVISVFMIVVGIALAVLRRIFKYKLISCYDALYGENASLMIEQENIEESKEEQSN